MLLYINIESILETNNNKNRCIEIKIETTLLFYCVNIENIKGLVT